MKEQGTEKLGGGGGGGVGGGYGCEGGGGLWVSEKAPCCGGSPRLQDANPGSLIEHPVVAPRITSLQQKSEPTQSETGGFRLENLGDPPPANRRCRPRVL